MRFKRLALILLFWLTTATAYGQSITRDSCICYTNKQDLKSIECFILQAKKDVLISQYIKLIESNVLKNELQEELNGKQKEVIEAKEIKIKKKNKDIAKLTAIAIITTIISIIK